MIGNKECDKINSFKSCENYDGGDCLESLCPRPDLIGNGQCDNAYKDNYKCNYDGGDCANVFFEKRCKKATF